MEKGFFGKTKQLKTFLPSKGNFRKSKVKMGFLVNEI